MMSLLSPARRMRDAFRRKFGVAGTTVRVVNDATGRLEQKITVPYQSHIEFELVSEIGEIVTCRGSFGTWTAWFGVDGYGNLLDVDELAAQVAIDVYHHNMPANYYEDLDHPSAGHAMLLLWPDINVESENIVSLGLARVDNREPEGD